MNVESGSQGSEKVAHAVYGISFELRTGGGLTGSVHTDGQIVRGTITGKMCLAIVMRLKLWSRKIFAAITN